MTARDRSKAKHGTILVVDDEVGIVDVLIAVLTDAGYRAAGAANGQEALAKVEECHPQLVVLDLEMPVLDGAETLRALRASTAGARLPVVVMSGLTESIVKRRCKSHQAFLRKPFTLDDLLGVVARLLKPGGGPPRARRKKAR